MPTVSIAKGRGYARHNDRSLDSKDQEKKSWDPRLSNQNITYKNESIRNAYDRIFGGALNEYNQSQIKKGRADRQIKDYYEKINRSKQEKACYEFIIQIGSIEDKQNLQQYARIQAALDEFNRSFQERNPNFKVFQQITHRDEKGMDHTHIMFIPVSTGNKRGLETKNSLSGALKEMGYGRNGFEQWREHELDTIKSIMKEHELEFELGDGRTEHLNVRQYREYKKYESLTLEKQNALSELDKSVSERFADMDRLNTQINSINAQINRKRAEIEDLESKKEVLSKNPTREIVDNQQIKGIVQEFIENYKEQKQAEKDELYDKDNAFAKAIHDDEVTIKKTFRGDSIVSMPYTQWVQFRDSHNKLVSKFKELREILYKGLDKLIKLFDVARKEPEYLNALKSSKLIKLLQNKTSDMENTINELKADNEQYRNQINYYMTRENEEISALEILDVLGTQMRNTFYVDQYGQEVNLLNRMMDEAELNEYAVNILNNRIDSYEEKYKNKSNEHEWDFER